MKQISTCISVDSLEEAKKGPDVLSEQQLIGAVSRAGVIHYAVRRGSFTKPLFQAWIRESLARADAVDNASIHSAVEELQNLNTATGEVAANDQEAVMYMVNEACS